MSTQLSFTSQKPNFFNKMIWFSTLQIRLSFNCWKNGCLPIWKLLFLLYTYFLPAPSVKKVMVYGLFLNTIFYFIFLPQPKTSLLATHVWASTIFFCSANSNYSSIWYELMRERFSCLTDSLIRMPHLSFLANKSVYM